MNKNCQSLCKKCIFITAGLNCPPPLPISSLRDSFSLPMHPKAVPVVPKWLRRWSKPANSATSVAIAAPVFSLLSPGLARDPVRSYSELRIAASFARTIPILSSKMPPCFFPPKCLPASFLQNASLLLSSKMPPCRPDFLRYR
jgi:hypothetical protein